MVFLYMINITEDNTMSDFFQKNNQVLQNYVRLSTEPGKRVDYVQGGGGNTSCKFDDKLMAIKASGFRLSQVSVDNAYAVLDYASIVDFYKNTDPSKLEDVEKAGSDVAKQSIQTIEGLPALRPSVEAGFHSLLSKYVLHTHPVYANLATCCVTGREIAAKALASASYSFGYVPYINPGANLTFAIAAEQDRVMKETGKMPSAIFMQNHGLIATSDDLEETLKIHEEVNKLIAAEFKISEKDFPAILLEEVENTEGAEADNLFISDTQWLKNKITNPKYDMDYFCMNALYPDQLVFLNGNVTIVDTELPQDGQTWAQNKCTIYRKTGDIVYHCMKGEASTIEETLAAVIFITSTIEKAGNKVCTMSESGKDFIANWEGEKYRKSVAEQR
jgi:rhamnose utilization protein RhaD (predicted bifunctional aldolase and dehydrogenase)